jgi:hypothetical protein
VFAKAIQNALAGVRDAVFNFVLIFFEAVNEKIRSNLPIWRMEEETSEHVHMLAKVFKFVIFPVSLFYFFADFYLFREIPLGSMLWGILIFFYSNFLPDLPSIFRARKENERTNEELPWYKKYALLLLAPLFIWILFSGIRLQWETAENFHNFKSLATFGFFLIFCGLFAYGKPPIDIGSITAVLFPPLYGLIGYLTHLKVDQIW